MVEHSVWLVWAILWVPTILVGLSVRWYCDSSEIGFLAALTIPLFTIPLHVMPVGYHMLMIVMFVIVAFVHLQSMFWHLGNDWPKEIEHGNQRHDS